MRIFGSRHRTRIDSADKFVPFCWVGSVFGDEVVEELIAFVSVCFSGAEDEVFVVVDVLE